MSESVIYADIQFKNFKKGTTFNAKRTPSLHDTEHTDVSILRAARDPPEADAAAPQPVGPRGGSRVKSGGWNPKRIALVLVCALLAVAVAGLGVLYMQTKQKLNACVAQHEDGTGNLHGDTTFPCEEEGWLSHGEKCYYFSNHTLTWEMSREHCRKQCGDLVKIETREEQEFLEKTLQAKMTGDEDKFWIGLTDSKIESEWLWVDGSQLNIRFWSPGEPDNWENLNPNGEDCVRMGERGGTKDLNCWFDQPCDKPQRMVCEKTAASGGALACKCKRC